jgi:peptidoglycan hydrolase CwlO-like protein
MRYPTEKTSNSHFVGIGAIAFAALLYLMIASGGFAKDDGQSQKEILKTRIDDLRRQIEMYQTKIDEKSQKEESLSGDIEILEADIKKMELQIQETSLQIEELDGEIFRKETEIERMQKQVDAKEKMLANFLEELYEKGRNDAAEIIFTGQSFSEYYAKIESLENIESRIKDSHSQLKAERDALKKERGDLIERKIDKENMRGIQSDQERSIQSEKQMKDLLVSKIQDEKAALEQNVDRLKEELNAIQSLGNPINMEEAVAAAKYASKFTNVAPEFLLGVLRVESGLGTNVGGGRYKTDMNPAQWDTFKKICAEIGIDPEKTPVSRRACYNRDSKDGCGGWGGAMGPAQFMPSTWMGYKVKVENLTGNKPANPWEIKDSLVAMGLKLAAVEGVTGGDRKAWAKAAGMYLAGGNWERYSWYSDRVLHYADGFKKILKDY